MKTTTLGAVSGIDVSRIGLGLMGISAFYTGAGQDDADGARTILGALDRGVTFLDTAEMYGPYTNEELLSRGLTLMARGRARDVDGAVVLDHHAGGGGGVEDRRAGAEIVGGDQDDAPCAEVRVEAAGARETRQLVTAARAPAAFEDALSHQRLQTRLHMASRTLMPDRKRCV